MAKALDYHTIRDAFDRFEAAEAHPKGELNHVNAYTLVVAVALSAQATDVGVNKATRALFKIADTPQKMLDLGLGGLTEHIKTIGLFRQKAKNVMAGKDVLLFIGDVQQAGRYHPVETSALEPRPEGRLSSTNWSMARS